LRELPLASMAAQNETVSSLRSALFFALGGIQYGC
jgi:hypothetical protein